MNLFQCLAVSFLCGVIEFEYVFAKDYYKILGNFFGFNHEKICKKINYFRDLEENQIFYN